MNQFDFRTFTIHSKPVFGIYGEDFVQFGTFLTEGDPMNDEAFLLQITENNSPHIGERITFKYDTDKIIFSHEVNPENCDVNLVHPIEESVLIPETRTTWTERLYLGSSGN